MKKEKQSSSISSTSRSITSGSSTKEVREYHQKGIDYIFAITSIMFGTKNKKRLKELVEILTNLPLNDENEERIQDFLYPMKWEKDKIEKLENRDPNLLKYYRIKQ